MITCESFVDRGFLRVFGLSPNGPTTVVREVEGQPTQLVRGGALNVTTGGISLDDTEAPLGVPITYRVSVTGITTANRIIQQNLMATPTFLHGAQGWLPGTDAGRALNIVADPTAHSSLVGLFAGSTAPTAAPAVPTLVGHVDTPVVTNSTYSLQPPITGGTAIAVGDWMMLVHQQSASAAAPVPVPIGLSSWTLLHDRINRTIRQVIWIRKRDSNDQTGNLGYQVTTASNAAAIATLIWVRGATQDEVVLSVPIIASGNRDYLATAPRSVIRPRLTITLFSATTEDDQVPPGTAEVTGGTWQYTRSSGNTPTTMVVAKDSGANAGLPPQVIATYGGTVAAGVALSVSFQAGSALTNRVIARGRVTTLPYVPQPYLLTGRFRYVTNTLNTWQQIKNIGTWQQVKTAKATWLDARGTESTAVSDFLSLFLAIVNPTTGANYIDPVQVFDAGEARLNVWTDFSALFSAPVGGIPSTAEVRLIHGTKSREYAADFYLDEFGITPGAQYFGHDTLYWFDGDTPVPATPLDYSFPGWVIGPGGGASITWTGTVGNSASLFNGPSTVAGVTTCQLDPSDSALLLPCEPVLLSDPINVTLASWVGLIHIDPLTHPAKQSVHQIINRAAPVAISQVRGWETGTITVLTMTSAHRAQLLNLLRSGRVLLMRNPVPEYPENNWFIAVGDVIEDRPVPNQRVTVREWTMPFVRVERPVGLIEAGSARTWQQVKDSGTWQNLRDTTQDWLDVLSIESVG